MICSHGLPLFKKNAQVNIRNLKFSMFKYICQKSVESLQKCGDFHFVVLMFEGLPSNGNPAPKKGKRINPSLCPGFAGAYFRFLLRLSN
jgi:hypothetical protein